MQRQEATESGKKIKLRENSLFSCARDCICRISKVPVFLHRFIYAAEHRDDNIDGFLFTLRFLACFLVIFCQLFMTTINDFYFFLYS